MIALLNLFALFAISVLVLATIRKRKFYFIVSFGLSLFIVMQLASLYVGGSLIDYKFFVHANWSDITAMMDMFMLEGIVAIVVLILLPWVLDLTVQKTQGLREKLGKRQTAIVAGVCIVLMVLNGGIINNGYGILKVLTANSVDFEVALRDLDMNSYIASSDAKGSEGRNVIIISLESYEKGYLSDQKQDLTPNLRQLSSKWSFVDMKENEGSRWTVASLYGAMTGLPAFFKGDGNEVFKQALNTKIANVGQILKSAGYSTTFLTGDASFAGTADLLRVFEFDNIVDRQNIAQLYGANFTTAYDKDLFDAAKIEVANLKKGGRPFALMLSTFDTHSPNGLYDARFQSTLKPQSSELEFMISAVDYMVGDFVAFLEKEGLLENTTVFIMPDHLKMGDATGLNGTGERGLFVLTNASKDKLKLDGSRPVYQIDLPQIILNGSEIDHNARFLTEYIDDDPDEYITSHTAALTALNHAGLVRKNSWDSEIRVVRENGGVQIHMGEKLILISADTLQGKVTRLSFSPEMRLLQTEYHPMSTNALPPFVSGLTFNVYGKNDSVFAYVQADTRVPVTKVSTSSITFTQDDVKVARRAPFQIDPQKPVNRFVHWEEREVWDIPGISSQGYNEAFLVIPYIINEGFIEITYTADSQAKPYVICFNQPYESFSVLLHDPISAPATRRTVRFPIQRSLKNAALIFRNWSHLGSFVVHNYQIVGTGHEYDMRFSSPSANADAYARDVTRFIAHAGGSIDNLTYTNCLEALDANYAKGFRMFEIDISKTSDGKFVGAHDWKHWAGLTEYPGSLPPTEAEFMKHQILKKYQPLNMYLINQWFASHKDAILVTDKVNEPRTFVPQFVDRKRLMMELFTLAAVREGLSTGMLSAMPSESVFPELGADRGATLIKLGVKSLALSRINIVYNIPLLQRLQKAGIKVYAFHVNAEPGKDEKYVVTYEMDYIHGIYADTWDLR